MAMDNNMVEKNGQVLQEFPEYFGAIVLHWRSHLLYFPPGALRRILC